MHKNLLKRSLQSKSRGYIIISTTGRYRAKNKQFKEGEEMPEVNKITDEDWDKPMVCPIDPKELAECEACQ